jgi:uncharacterized membrane protein YphA (DoxX/SURF4 family)
MSRTAHALPIVTRILLGLVFTIFGLNGFLQFLPQPELPPAAGQFVGALAASGYLFPLLKATELLAGLALLGGLFVPLALVVLAPIVVNIAAFHTFLAPGWPMVVFLLLAELYLAWHHRAAFRPLLVARLPVATRTDATPHAGRASALG